jgi:hypothetical protein
VKQALRRIFRSPALVGALLACACAVLCLLHRAGDEIRFIERLERATLDLRFQSRGPAAHRRRGGDRGARRRDPRRDAGARRAARGRRPG